jgi:hypothetical protein
LAARLNCRAAVIVSKVIIVQGLAMVDSRLSIRVGMSKL